MPPKLSLADQKKQLKLKEQRAKDKEKAEKEKERAERKALESKDKIFGLKNKTGKAVQGFVQDVERNLKALPGEQQKAEAKAREKAKKAAAEAQAQKELEEIMGIPIKQPKVPEGVDPKTIMCEFFKKGRCAKEWKCKFSHERKSGARKDSAEIDLFTDARDEAEQAKEKEEDRMEDWDQAKLESVVAEKHGGENLNNKTTISCKHFLDAVEKRLYGWFWVCPGGGVDCKYRHALPPGYVLKSQLAALAAEQKSARRTDEEVLEERRAKLGGGVQLNRTLFLEWKEEREKRRGKEKQEAKEARQREGRMSGRELCEAGLVESGGHEEDGAMEYVKRDTSADDAAEAMAREEAERNLARMRAMFAASGGVEGGDRSEWFASGGGGDGDDDGEGDGDRDEDDADDFFVDEDDMDEDELAAMLGQVTVGGGAPAGGAGGSGAGGASSGEAGQSVVGSSNRARAAAAARRKLQQDEEALSGFLSNLDGEGGGGGGLGGSGGAKFVGTIKHREKDPNKKSKLPKKGGGGKKGDSDSEPEEELEPELQAMLTKRADKSSQLRDIKLDTGLVTKSGAKSKTLLAAEAKQQQEQEQKMASAAAAAAEKDPFAVGDDNDPFAVDDDDVDFDELVAAVKQ